MMLVFQFDHKTKAENPLKLKTCISVIEKNKSKK